MKGSEIAKKLNISTSTLRHYEAWGIVPPVERAANGYRVYTKEHEVYFQCIRDLYAGFGMNLIREAMPRIVRGEILDALWLINKAQVRLHTEKETVQKTVDMLGLTALSDLPAYRNKSSFTIGEVAEEANVSASSIRHWEKEGLIKPQRRQESRFRMYSPSDIRRVLVIRTVQRAVYSLDTVREVLSKLDQHNIAQAKDIARKALEYIDHALARQMRGIASLQRLLDMTDHKHRGE
ncbi:MerR family transcriptional regulator [Cohnella sp. GCM10020058]|uniref:MerR family transcriptional regulator n=1 Tax=Cohnella sp. GCM10020058 TaxID=3317330 RepID=UPI003638DF1C